MQFLVLLREELRIFDSHTDQADDSVMVLRTVDSDNNPVTIRLGSKLGMPNCFILEDCGIFYTFCAGNADEQTKWKEAIEKVNKKPDAENNMNNNTDNDNVNNTENPAVVTIHESLED